MILTAFTIYDSSIEAFKPPMFARNDKEVTRDIVRVMNEGKSILSESPEDFTLFRIGTFNDNSGEIILEKAPVKVHTFLEIQTMMNQYEETSNAKQPDTPI